MPRSALALLLTVLAAAAAPWVAAVASAQDGCASQLSAAAQAASTSISTVFIDPHTPVDACTKPVCTGDYAACNVDFPPTSDLQLVFSDEFETVGRALGAGAKDHRWTADHMWYAGTSDMEVYVPEQVATEGGAAVLTIERAANASALSQQPDGVVWNMTKDFKSGFVSSWNKFCYTGGYMEARVQLPGNDFASGFWPAFWLMGNLGRAGHMATTSGFWPYTYSMCGGGDVGVDQPAGPTPQNISACPDPPGFDRTKFGLVPGVGRGAPEIDLLEVKVDSSVGHKLGDPQGGNPGQQHKPFSSITLQTAPLLPNGTTWTTTDVDGGVVPGPGQYLPTTNLPDWAYTHLTYWQGKYSQNVLDRPGNQYQDSVSAYCVLDPSFWTTYHTFGLHWMPGEYVRWYIDSHFVYEVSSEALRAQSNGTYSTGERLIPVEAMYIIFNLAMSSSFSTVDLEQLQFPSQYKVDYVRVYQIPDAFNIGCSPKNYPTAQYLACNRDKYLLTAEEAGLISGPCLNSVSCHQETGVDYQGGHMPLPGGEGYVRPQQLATVKACCQACQATAACGAYVYDPRIQTCYFKAPSGWTRVPTPDLLSGQVYDAGSTWPRSTTSSSSPPPSPSGGGGGGTPPSPDVSDAAVAVWQMGALLPLLLLAMLLLPG